MLNLRGIKFNGVSVSLTSFEVAIAAVWENLRSMLTSKSSLPWQVAVEVYIVDEPLTGFLIVRRDDDSLEPKSEFDGAGTYSLVYDTCVCNHGEFKIKYDNVGQPIATLSDAV